MNFLKFYIKLFITTFVTIGCSPLVPTTPAPNSSKEVVITASPTITATASPLATTTLLPDYPKGCIDLDQATLSPEKLIGLLVIEDSNFNNYFFDPTTNQVLGIGEKIQDPAFGTFINFVSPDKRLMLASDLSGNDIIRSVDTVIKTYTPQDDWNRGRWLDNERIFYQNWLVPNGNNIVIYNPFNGEQKSLQLNLPNPYIVIDGGNTVAWVKADIDPSLKLVLYNDKERRLVLWNLDTQKEIASLPSPVNLEDGAWSPDGRQFTISIPSQSSDMPVASELFTINMDGTVKQLTNLNQMFSFASEASVPSWSPDGRFIAFWLSVNNIPNSSSKDLRQWLAVTDTASLKTQIYCVTSNDSSYGYGIVWAPDGQDVIVNKVLPSGEPKPTLVDLAHQTQSVLETKGLWVKDWMSP